MRKKSKQKKAKLTLGAVIIPLCLALIHGCARVPIEFKLTKNLEITEKDLEDITNAIKNKLLAIDFSHPAGSPSGMIDPEECKSLYSRWLNRQFANGLVPKKVVGPEDYAQSSSNPLKSQCKSIDFTTEYKLSSDQIMSEQRRDIVLFNMQEAKNQVSQKRCLKAFIDPTKGKMEVARISITIEKNSLNVASPAYNVYSSNQALTEDEITTKSEQNFVDDGTFMLFAKSESIPAKFTGTSRLETIGDQEQYNKAVIPLLSLTGSFVAYPNFLQFEPETREREGQTYYIVPTGGLKASIRIMFNFFASLKDAACTFSDFTDQIKSLEHSLP